MILEWMSFRMGVTHVMYFLKTLKCLLLTTMSWRRCSERPFLPAFLLTVTLALTVNSHCSKQSKSQSYIWIMSSCLYITYVFGRDFSVAVHQSFYVRSFYFRFAFVKGVTSSAAKPEAGRNILTLGVELRNHRYRLWYQLCFTAGQCWEAL